VLTSEQLTVSAFAKLKITGLKSRNTIDAYRRQWQRAMDEADAPDVKPGHKVTLPDLDWTWEGVSDQNERRYVDQANPAALARAVGKLPEFGREAFAQDLDDESAQQIVDRVAEERYPIVQRAQQDAVIRSYSKRRDAWGDDYPDVPRGRNVVPEVTSLMRIGDACALIAEQVREIRRLLHDLDAEEMEAAAVRLEHTSGMVSLLHAYAAGTTGLDDELASLIAGEVES
jgi:hypothetical protein